MKIKNLFYCAIAPTLLFTSCLPEEVETTTKNYLIDFEDVVLTEGVWNGSDLSGDPKTEEAWGSEITNYYGAFHSGVGAFHNIYAKEWYSWAGFACSSKNDTETSGYENQYSAITGKGANNSAQYAVGFDSGLTFSCPKNELGYFKIKSMMITNSTYAYLSMKEGYGCKKFAEGDWYKVTIKGYKGETETGSVDYYLADFRDGKEILSNKWEKVDVSDLGEVDKVVFSFDSTDKTGDWLNNPTYVCIDNIEFTQETVEIK